MSHALLFNNKKKETIKAFSFAVNKTTTFQKQQHIHEQIEYTNQNISAKVKKTQGETEKVGILV